MTLKPYQFVRDPGHGWLRVRRAELGELRIEHLITAYSYENPRTGHVWLEEDVDMGRFLDAKLDNRLGDYDAAARAKVRKWWHDNVNETDVETTSVRLLPRYTGGRPR